MVQRYRQIKRDPIINAKPLSGLILSVLVRYKKIETSPSDGNTFQSMELGNLLLFHFVIVLSLQVTHQSVIRREANRLESNAHQSGKRLLIYSRVSQGFLQIVGKKNITATARMDDPNAVVIIDSGKEGLTIMGEKSQLYLCVLRKNGKMVAMASSSSHRYYCLYKENVNIFSLTTYELVDEPGWSLLFSKDGSPRRANNPKVDHKKTGFMKETLNSSKR